MGRLLAPYGVKGWVKARPYTASLDALLDYPSWWLTTDEESGVWNEFRVIVARPQGDTLVAELEGLTSRDAAQAWRGAMVGVARASLPVPAQGEFYWDALVGLEVINRSAQRLGRVAGLLDTGAHAVLRVSADDGTQRLIPMVAAYVDAIEPDEQRILVDWQLDY